MVCVVMWGFSNGKGGGEGWEGVDMFEVGLYGCVFDG